MQRFDFVNGIDTQDVCLFYFDGEYAGHDDQVEFGDLTPLGTEATITVAHWELLPEWDGEYPDTFDELRPFLKPMGPVEREA